MLVWFFHVFWFIYNVTDWLKNSLISIPVVSWLSKSNLTDLPYIKYSIYVYMIHTQFDMWAVLRKDSVKKEKKSFFDMTLKCS